MIKTTASVASVLGLLLSVAGPAMADEFLGSYQARISQQDHEASDGYALSTAAQMVRQDRANFHKFGRGDPEDENDTWFDSAPTRVTMERMLNRPNAMSASTRRAIERGEPVVEVDVYAQSVKVKIVGN